MPEVGFADSVVEPERIEDRPSFERALEKLINKYSIENESNTPDFILAQFLRDCLNSFRDAVRFRDAWYGCKPWEGQ